jgi:hypothetical protein
MRQMHERKLVNQETASVGDRLYNVLDWLYCLSLLVNWLGGLYGAEMRGAVTLEIPQIDINV